MSSPDTLPEPIVAAHKRMEFGFQRLTDNEATRLLECATAEFRRAERLQTGLNNAEAYNRESAGIIKLQLAEISGLQRVKWRLVYALIAAVSVIAGLIALWSAHAS